MPLVSLPAGVQMTPALLKRIIEGCDVCNPCSGSGASSGTTNPCEPYPCCCTPETLTFTLDADCMPSPVSITLNFVSPPVFGQTYAWEGSDPTAVSGGCGGCDGNPAGSWTDAATLSVTHGCLWDDAISGCGVFTQFTYFTATLNIFGYICWDGGLPSAPTINYCNPTSYEMTSTITCSPTDPAMYGYIKSNCSSCAGGSVYVSITE